LVLAAGDGQHRPHRLVERVGDAARLVHDRQPGAQESANELLVLRQDDDAAAVEQEQLQLRPLAGADRLAEGAVVAEDLGRQPAGLPIGGAEQQHQ
jgi:hypothetical protein